MTSYVIVRPLCTALALITSQFGVYAEGSLSPNKAYPYLAMATNLSQVTHSSLLAVHSGFCCTLAEYRVAGCMQHIHVYAWRACSLGCLWLCRASPASAKHVGIF